VTAAQVQDLFYNGCGLKGLSGISTDVRELEASLDPQARFALDYFAYRVGLSAGLLAAALGGLDAFVFTAGIGPGMRAHGTAHGSRSAAACAGVCVRNITARHVRRQVRREIRRY
jgi:acetate kinase